MLEPLALARCELVGHSRSSMSYCQANDIDWTATWPSTGGLRLVDIEIEPGRRFQIVRRGVEGAVEAAIVEALDEDYETVLDLVAWPVEDPSRVLSMFGRAPALGIAHATNPSTFAFSFPLQLFRTPLAWLQAGCRGAVLLDMPRGARWLIADVDGDLAVEDDAHAAELHRALSKAAGLDRIVVPDRRTQVAA